MAAREPFNPQMPYVPEDLIKRIWPVRRDMSNLLFHFTRASENVPGVKVKAVKVLEKILHDGMLVGTGTWTEGLNCVCFTEAPIPEFAAMFSLVEIAASADQRPRYEPYGIAVRKDWLFQQGGRPVIYERRSAFGSYAEEQRYRLVPFDPQEGKDFTWEREWKIQTKELVLDALEILVVVPTAREAFDLMDESVPAKRGEGTTSSYDSQFRIPKWMAVSLDLFGVRFNGHTK